MRSVSVMLLLASGCAGPLLGPELKLEATRTALRAALDEDGVVEPARGERLALQPAEAAPVVMPIRSAAPAPVPATPPPAVEAATASAGDAVGRTPPPVARDEDLVAALRELRAELSEQRTLKLIELVGRSDEWAPEAVDGPSVRGLERALEQVQDEQRQARERSVELEAELDVLATLLRERLPEQLPQQLSALQQSVESVDARVRDVSTGQRDLERRLDELERQSTPAPAPTPPARTPVRFSLEELVPRAEGEEEPDAPAPAGEGATDEASEVPAASGEDGG